MIERFLRTFKIKILFFIYIKPPLLARFGRHSATELFPKFIISKENVYINKILSI